MKKTIVGVSLALLLVTGLCWAQASNEEALTGEVVDLACYVSNGAKGPDHAGCAKTCAKGGQPMGLLTDDGALFLLSADHKDGEPYEALKDLAGDRAVVTGELSEKGGIKMITVTGSKAAP